MSGLRDLARPMLASIFVVQGMANFEHPEHAAELAEPIVTPIAARIPMVPEKAEHAVRLNAAVQTVAGGMLGLGLFPRLAALTIAGSMVPTTLAGHSFWQLEDPQDRRQQSIQFLKNVTIIGGLLLAAVDTGGKPSLAWRSRQARRAAAGTARTTVGHLARAGRATQAAQASRAAQAKRAAELKRAAQLRRAAQMKRTLETRRAAHLTGAARGSAVAGSRSVRLPWR